MSTPGDIIISNIKIKDKDLQYIVKELNVYESIYSNHVRGDIVLTESLGLFNQEPYIGEEEVQIKFKTPNCGDFEFNGRTTKIDRLLPTKDRKVSYRIEFTSKYNISNLTRTLSKAYKKMKISEMVKKIAQTVDIQNIELDETEGDLTIIIPRLSPFDAVEFLGSEAKSKKYPPSNYWFYETREKHFFVPIEKLIEKGKGSPVAQYYFFEKDAETDSFFAGGNKNTPDFYTITNVSFDPLFDIEFNIIEGMYDSITYEIDPLMQVYRKVLINGDDAFIYDNSFEQFKHISAYGGEKKLTEQNFSSLHGLSRINYLYSNRPQSKQSNMGIQERQRPKTIMLSASANRQLKPLQMTYTVPGNSDLKVGDMIALNIPSFDGTEGNEGGLDDKHSGGWLIVGLRNKFTMSSGNPYSTVMQCLKNCYEG
jgi:hypothetical protein